MAKYLLLWEVDVSKAPIDAKERATAWGIMMDMVKQDQAKGLTKDWGAIVGELNGYSVVEGTEVEIGNMVQKYFPFVTFKTLPVASFGQVSEIIKSLSG